MVGKVVGSTSTSSAAYFWPLITVFRHLHALSLSLSHTHTHTHTHTHNATNWHLNLYMLLYTNLEIRRFHAHKHAKSNTTTHSHILRKSTVHKGLVHIRKHTHTHWSTQRCVLAASGFETDVALLSFIPSEVFFILFFPVENRIHDPSPFLLTAQAIRCLGKRFPGYFSCLTKHLMTQVAWKVCNSICQWLLLCGADSHSYVLIMGIFCRLGCQAKQFLKAEEKRFYRLCGDLLNGPSCLFKFRLIAGSHFSEVSLCATREREWETKCGKGVHRRRWSEEGRGYLQNDSRSEDLWWMWERRLHRWFPSVCVSEHAASV